MAIADDEAFTIHLVSPPHAPKEIFRQSDKLEVHGLSADGKLILLQTGVAGDWLLPGLIVIDLKGQIWARLDTYAGVRGCWAGAWSPIIGEQRIVFRHETTGFFQPAFWWPLEDRVEDMATPLEGEVFPIWDKLAKALILKRCLDGRSDLWRLNLSDKRLEQLQSLDGAIFSLQLGSDGQAVGIWTSNEHFVESFAEKERIPVAGFKPERPLNPWRFRRIAGIPCFVIADSVWSGPRWTIFDGYGMHGYHHIDAYNSRSQVLADHGFQVVMVNTRGCGGFGRVWREAKRSNLGFTELEDMATVRAALVEEGVADSQRTIIAGDSWGGLMTLLAMGTQPDLWQMGVAGAPVGDYERCHWEASPLIRAVNRSEFGGDAHSHAAAYQKVSPLTYVDSIRGPIIMFCGKYDLLCPPKQNLMFAEALRARGGECELDLYEGGHGAIGREGRMRQQTLMLEFLTKHCRSIDKQLEGGDRTVPR